MKKTHRLMSLMLCILMILFTLGACGTGDDTTDGVSQSSDIKSSKGEEVVFTFARNEDVLTFDYYTTTNVVNNTLNTALFDTLLKSNHAGEFYPNVATEWSSSEDGKTWTIKLRDDVYFHNGEKLTSQCVKMTFERVAHTEDLSLNPEWENLISIDTPDEQTAIFNFEYANASFLTRLAFDPIYPCETFTEQGDAFFNHPIGSGAFKFENWDPGNKIEFVRNDEYWGWGNEKSNVDRIVFKPIMEETTRVSGIRTGELDLAENIPLDQVTLLQSEGLVVDPFDTYEHLYLGVSCREDSIFSDIRARQALSYAIDRQLIVDSIVGGGEASIWPVEPGCIGYDENSTGYIYDPEKAKDLLEETDYNGEELSIIVSVGKNPRSKEVLQAIMSMLTDVGFNVNLEMLENAAYNERRAMGNYDLQYSGAVQRDGDTLRILYADGPQDRYNTKFVNEQSNQWAEEMRKTTDREEYDKLARQICQAHMNDLAPNIYLYRTNGAYAMQKNISGVEIFPDMIMDISRVMKDQ